MLTFWTSERDLAGFAGKDVTAAKYYDFDKDFLIEFASNAQHFEVFKD
jgi:hypothetical protein